MEAVFACVTSCIGGKNDRYAVRVHPIQRRVYFVYKRLHDFQHLWIQLKTILDQDPTTTSTHHKTMEESNFHDWMRSFVNDVSLHDLNSKFQSEQKETTSLLNSFLQLLVRRIAQVSSTTELSQRVLTLVRDFLECSQSQLQIQTQRQVVANRMKKRQFGKITTTSSSSSSERPQQDMPVFPIRCSSKIHANKIRRRLSSVDEDLEITVKSPKPVQFPLSLPHVHANGPSRRRVFAEVNFDII